MFDADNFNPHSPCGERPPPMAIGAMATLFQSTLPLRGATGRRYRYETPVTFQSTLPLRGATFRQESPQATHNRYFNPHSPCGERPVHDPMGVEGHDFNPHSPCGERHVSGLVDSIRESFQSTLPLRGATAKMRHF